jgi:hypothetical protein
VDRTWSAVGAHQSLDPRQIRPGGGCWLCPKLRPSVGPGRPYTYPDTVVLPTVIVMRVWRKGHESFTGWLARNKSLAERLGYRSCGPDGQLETISAAQLSHRARHLGILPFLLFFVGLVWQSIHLGAIGAGI